MGVKFKTNKPNNESGQLSFFQTSMNLMKAIVGSGLLMLPLAFSWSGVYLSFVLVIISGLFTFYGVQLVTEVCEFRDIYPKHYPDFVNNLFGGKAKKTLMIIIIQKQLSLVIGYCMFFTMYFQETFCFYRIEDMCENRYYSVLFALILVLPLSMIKDLKTFSFSAYGNIMIALSLFAILYHAYNVRQEVIFKQIQGPLNLYNWEHSALSLGLITHSFGFPGIQFDLRYNMKESKQFMKVVKYVLMSLATLYFFYSVYTYSAFQGGLKEIILFNLPLNNPIYISVILIYCLALCISYPLQLYPIFVLADELFQEFNKPQHKKLMEEAAKNNINNKNNNNINGCRNDIGSKETNTCSCCSISETSSCISSNSCQFNNNNNGYQHEVENGNSYQEYTKLLQNDIDEEEGDKQQQQDGENNNNNVKNYGSCDEGSIKDEQKNQIQEELNLITTIWEREIFGGLTVFSICLRIFVTVFVFIITYLISNIGIFTSFCAAINDYLLMFIIPVLAYYKCQSFNRIKIRRHLLNILLMIFALIAGWIGVKKSLMVMLED